MLTKDAAENANHVNAGFAFFGGVFRQHDGWLRQPPVACSPFLCCSVF